MNFSLLNRVVLVLKTYLYESQPESMCCSMLCEFNHTTHIIFDPLKCVCALNHILNISRSKSLKKLFAISMHFQLQFFVKDTP